MAARDREFSLGTSIVLTIGSAVLWGVAHLATGRRRTGLALMTVYAVLLASVLTMVTVLGSHLLSLAVQPGWLTALTVTLIAIAVAWSTVILWSYALVRPAVGRRATTILAVVLCAAVVAPTAYAARLAYVSRDVVTSLFTANTAPIVTQDPWNGADRFTILLVGADSAPNRPGVRTDSMTVATVDIATGATTLLGLPRNLQNVPMPSGPARERFPYGFTGEPPYTPGLLNEVFQYGEDYPEVVPGARRATHGSTLLKQTVSGILGIPVTYYAMVDMHGFAQIIDAMGGVKVTIKEPIVYGKYREGLLAAGTRKLTGEQALWYGRSRTDSDDYVRMGRQKCLLNAVAKQADPMTVLNSFESLATATKRAISTDVPQNLLPALVDLAQKVKDTRIRSLSFVPPLISTVYPDWSLIRRKVAQAIADRPANKTATAPGERPEATLTPSADRPITLDESCG
ncbi:LCP family protein [Nonomuraea typhae]|uniref:LCP family protein n=1 Tax=Nonomuraea typhae TaxID=2603600 RepID=A0ABW7YWI9_9ACTN